MRGWFLAASAAAIFTSSVLADVLIVGVSIVGCLVLFDSRSFLTIVHGDSLQLAFTVWDFAKHDYAWRGFQFSRVPSLFPDLAVFAPVQLLTGSWRFAFLVYGTVTLLGLALVAGWIIDGITRCSWRTGARAFLLLILPMQVLELPMTVASRHLEILGPNSHGGPFVLALAALCVVWASVQQSSVPRSLLLFAMATAGNLSDPLFFIAFDGPIIVVLAYRSIRGRTAGRTAAFVLIPVLAALAAARLLDLLLIREPAPDLDWARVTEHAWAFLISPGELAAAAPMIVLLTLALPLAFFLCFPLLRRLSGDRQHMTDPAAFWWSLGTVSTVGVVATTALVYENATSYRYTLPLQWWSLIFTAAVFVEALGRARRSVIVTGLSSVTVAFAGVYLWQGFHSPAILTLHHPLETCLVDGQRIAGLKAGLANYWYAREIAASSDWQLQIDQIETDGAAMYFGNDRFWFTHDVHDGTRAPEYNYILMTRLDERAIKSNYGAPSRILDCGSSAVWVYDDAAAVRRALVQGSPALYATFLDEGQGIDQICVPAYRFYSRAYQKGAAHLAALAGPLEARAGTSEDGPLQIWGPYFSLPRGRWVISLIYRLMTDAPRRDHWEITASSRREKLFEGPLAPTLGGGRVAQAEIELGRHKDDIEIQSFLADTGIIEVIGARIARAGSGQPTPCGWE